MKLKERSKLKAKIKILNTSLKVNVNMICATNINYILLYVNEGLLLCDFEDNASYFYVMKK